MARATTSDSAALQNGRTGIAWDDGTKAGIVGLKSAVKALCQTVPWVEAMEPTKAAVR